MEPMVWFRKWFVAARRAVRVHRRDPGRDHGESPAVAETARCGMKPLGRCVSVVGIWRLRGTPHAFPSPIIAARESPPFTKGGPGGVRSAVDVAPGIRISHSPARASGARTIRDSRKTSRAVLSPPQGAISLFAQSGGRCRCSGNDPRLLSGIPLRDAAVRPTYGGSCVETAWPAAVGSEKTSQALRVPQSRILCVVGQTKTTVCPANELWADSAHWRLTRRFALPESRAGT